MQLHELMSIVIVRCFAFGLYLPSVRKIIRWNLIVTVGNILSVLPILLTPYFLLTFGLPCLDENLVITTRFFMFMSFIATIPIAYMLYSFHFNRQGFEKLFRIWDMGFGTTFYPELRQNIFFKTKKMTEKWIVIFGNLQVVTIIAYGFLPLFYRKKELEHPVAIPYRRQSPDFEIIVLLELFSTVYLVGIAHYYNSLLLQFVAYEKAECEHLKLTLSDIIGTLKVTEKGDIRWNKDPNQEQNDPFVQSPNPNYAEICSEVETKMGVWVKQHQNLLRFHEELRKIYHKPLSVQFSGLLLNVCLAAFASINGFLTASQMFVCISYNINNYTLFYVICFYADLATIESEIIFQEAFGDSWYLYPRSLRTRMHIIAMRCQKPLKLVAFAIFPLSSYSFAKIFTSSYSIFTFLFRVVNRE